MKWNWTQRGWPQFTYDAAALEPLERRFLLSSGEVIGAVRHISDEERNLLRIELLSDEAVKTSEIEGEMLDRLSVQSSLRRQFGLDADNRPIKPQERGIAEMMVDVYDSWSVPLNHETLFRWHDMLMTGNRHIGTIGGYRTHDDAMQIVSGRLDRPTVHYEAPPSRQVPAEMAAYTKWFNRSAPKGEIPLPALTRAGIGHLYFESIHPFEDGNGRLGRALTEKSLAQNIGHPSLIALAYTIEHGRKAYYDQLERHQRTLDITEWLVYFGETILEAQQTTLMRVAFYISKAQFYDRFRGQFNERQEKAVARMFREGPTGFKGGLSAENYIAITRTSRATATRDLHDLVEKGALTRSGERRHTRYVLNLWEINGTE
ncbi:Fic family protein [Rhizobium rhizogenes]|uniref:Fic family protein n=1 Tax=Rhizobium rhizogenes TaxID=359 RepID=UPI00157421DC|nr:Fic family protein [Rhizobium rhizogenes]NTF59645.1 Fic family protein [Rhizobium rhizogenes]NTF64011.1 Fic family protein [Rhizobium rhizogenes]NTF79205.1 Fic family protein [Rhizobium rhizogenes]NTG02953.1 Fic family protein [Rhizobium rhizogenes]NTG10016.1 Fic family protein [Rhizobium rhizogenes]